MITKEFKNQMRDFLISVFDVRSSVLCSPYSLNNDMSFDEDLFMIRAPLIEGQELLDFFVEEGLCVKKTDFGLYTISLIL
jgi:hypothetical protein